MFFSLGEQIQTVAPVVLWWPNPIPLNQPGHLPGSMRHIAPPSPLLLQSQKECSWPLCAADHSLAEQGDFPPHLPVKVVSCTGRWERAGRTPSGIGTLMMLMEACATQIPVSGLAGTGHEIGPLRVHICFPRETKMKCPPPIVMPKLQLYPVLHIQ